MNVLEVVSARDINGPAVHVLDLSRELSARGHRMTIVCRPCSWVEGEAARRGLDVVPSDLHRLPPDELRRLAAVVRELGVDVVHTHMSRAHFFGVLLRSVARVPCVATAHSRNLQLHWVLNDRVIAVSEATARFHRRFNLVPRGRMDVVPAFVDTARFAPREEAGRSEARAALAAGDGPLLGVVASIHERKGLHVLVAALPLLVARWPSLRVAIAGGGDDGYRERLTEAARRSGAGGAVVWLGPRTDVPDLLAAFEILVLPSLEEPLGMVLIEAMAAGVPVVASAVGGTPEVVEDAVTGLLVPPRDPARLARAIATLLDDPARAASMGTAGRRRAEALFRAETVVPRIEAVLRRAAERR